MHSLPPTPTLCSVRRHAQRRFRCRLDTVLTLSGATAYINLGLALEVSRSFGARASGGWFPVTEDAVCKGGKPVTRARVRAWKKRTPGKTKL